MTASSTNYRLTLPALVEFGWGSRVRIGELAARMGRRAWLISGSRTLDRTGAIAEIEAALRSAGLAVERLPDISREPYIADVDRAAVSLRTARAAVGDMVIGVGGGSAIDLAKAVAAMATNRAGDSVRDYLEGIGRGLALDVPPLPIVAVPTTSGTGSEATRNAVISSVDPPMKKSLRSERLVPSLVVIDPELTTALPPTVTAHTGLDAITQLIESFLSRRANAFTDGLCREGLRVALPMLERAYRDGHDREARTALSHAAFLSGMALANSGLGIAHGVAAALGVCCDVPHGLACALLLPTALRLNAEMRQSRIAEIGRLLEGDTPEMNDDAFAASRAIERIAALCERVGIPQSLRSAGVDPRQVGALVTASHGNSRSGNPRDISDEELHAALLALC